MWSGINRRKFPRAHYKCMISIKKKDSPKMISTYTENLGAGGICVIITQDLGLFQGVELELDLVNGVSENVRCNGTVVWVVKKRDIKERGAMQYDTGIEFVDINEGGQKRIVKIVEEQLK